VGRETEDECFNPRLREGGDCSRSPVPPLRVSFNPRLREGGDMGRWAGKRRTDVSIHASAREATRQARPLCGGSQSFNPRLREGGDVDLPDTSYARDLFQSTPPRGRRRNRRTRMLCNVLCFNPRLREGGDTPTRSCGHTWQTFQSTPPRGRRREKQTDQRQ